jgi:phage tail sheath gpL-like
MQSVFPKHTYRVAMLVACAAGLACLLAVSSSQAGPSSKFTYSTSNLALVKQTPGTDGWVTILSAALKTPASKEVLVSGSIEAGLFTQTEVRSKNMKKDASTASVAIQVQALIDGQPMPPGTVTYAARTQTLEATLEGAIRGCLSIVNNPDGTQTVVVDPNCVQPEIINLILSTLSANSFNFVARDVPVGDHMISLQARISSSTSVQNGTATAEGLVGKGTLIAEVVRAVR